jgi:hypothetical protein
VWNFIVKAHLSNAVTIGILQPPCQRERIGLKLLSYMRLWTGEGVGRGPGDVQFVGQRADSVQDSGQVLAQV